MPIVYSEHDEHPPTLAAVSYAQSYSRALAYRRSSRLRRYELLGRYREIRYTFTLLGDRTDNTPTLRRETKRRNTLNLTAYPYLLEPRGVCVQLRADGTVDIDKTLAVLTHYRYILASRKGVTTNGRS